MNRTYTSLSTELRTVPGADLVTSGGLQIVVACPNCGAQHRHLGLGLRRSPCGTWYAVARAAEAGTEG